MRERTDIIPDELLNALRRREGALAGYKRLNDSRKKQFLHWLYTAKKPETKQRRISSIVDEVLGDIPK